MIRMMMTMPPETKRLTAHEFEEIVGDLAAFARLHRALEHPLGSWPERECLTCPWIQERRRELAQQCPT